MADNLTIKQETFVKEYIETGNASEAYRRAYDAEDMSKDSIHVRASELKKNSKVAVRIEAELEKIDKGYIVNRLLSAQKAVEKILKRSIDDDEKDLTSLKATEQLRKNSMSLAEIHGMLIDKKINLNIDANEAIKDNGELARRLQFLLAGNQENPVA